MLKDPEYIQDTRELVHGRFYDGADFSIAKLVRSMDDGDEAIFFASHTDRFGEVFNAAYEFEREMHKDYDGRPAFGSHERDMYAFK